MKLLLFFCITITWENWRTRNSNRGQKNLIRNDKLHMIPRRGYSVSKRLVKLCSRISPRSCLGIKIYLRYHLCWVIYFNTLTGCSSVQNQVEDCISVQKLNTLNTDLQLILQNINKFAAGWTRPILINTRSSHSLQFCREFCGSF